MRIHDFVFEVEKRTEQFRIYVTGGGEVVPQVKEKKWQWVEWLSAKSYVTARKKVL